MPGSPCVDVGAILDSPPCGQIRHRSEAGAVPTRGATTEVFFNVAGWFVLPVIILVVGRAILIAIAAPRHVVRQASPELPGSCLPAVSIVVPAYNEAAGIAACVHSLAASNYPRFEIVVVDDGSSDLTGDIVEALRLANVWLIRQTNTGKARALNAGVGPARARSWSPLMPTPFSSRTRCFASSRRSPMNVSAQWPATPRSAIVRADWDGGSISSTSSPSTPIGAPSTCCAACPPSQERSVPSAAEHWNRWADSVTRRWRRTQISRWPSAAPVGPLSIVIAPVRGRRHRLTCDLSGINVSAGPPAPIGACGDTGGRYVKGALWVGEACRSWLPTRSSCHFSPRRSMSTPSPGSCWLNLAACSAWLRSPSPNSPSPPTCCASTVTACGPCGHSHSSSSPTAA